MQFGFRVIRGIVVGAVLGTVSALIVWPVTINPVLGSSKLVSDQIGFFLLFIICAFFIIICSYIVRAPSFCASVTNTVFKLAYPLRPLPFVAKILCAVIVMGTVLYGGIALFVGLAFRPAETAITYESFRPGATDILRYTVFTILPILAFYTPIVFVEQWERVREHPTFIRWFRQHRGGSSRWAGPRTFDRVAADPDIINGFSSDSVPMLLDGVYLGRSLFIDDFARRHVVLKDDGHLLTIGQPGSGKSITAIWPNLAMYNGSAIVVDPKGEHTRAFLGRRQDPDMFDRTDKMPSYRDPVEFVRYMNMSNQEKKQYNDGSWKGFGTDVRGLTTVKHHMSGRAFVLDPFNANGRYPSARYNPLSEIDVSSPNARKIISAVSTACITPSNGENRFWEDTARSMIDGVIAHVLSRYPKENHNLPFVADLLMGLDPNTGFADPGQFRKLLIDMRMNDAAGRLPQLAAAAVDDLGDRTYGNVTAELRTALKWATDPAMRPHLMHSDFTFASVGEQRTTVFIAIPFGHMVEQIRWLRTITQVSMRVLEQRSENDKKKIGRVLYVLDELPQYGAHLNAIKEGMVTLRSAGVKLWAFVQNIQQLTACFGEDGAKNFQSGGTVQVFGVSDDATAEWVARKVGSHQIELTNGILGRNVVGRREVELVPTAAVESELKKTAPIQYVFSSHGPPMRLERVAFKEMVIEGQRFNGLPLEGHYDE